MCFLCLEKKMMCTTLESYPLFDLRHVNDTLLAFEVKYVIHANLYVAPAACPYNNKC